MDRKAAEIGALANENENETQQDKDPSLLYKEEIRFKTLAWIHDRSHSNLVKG